MSEYDQDSYPKEGCIATKVAGEVDGSQPLPDLPGRGGRYLNRDDPAVVAATLQAAVEAERVKAEASSKAAVLRLSAMIRNDPRGFAVEHLALQAELDRARQDLSVAIRIKRISTASRVDPGDRERPADTIHWAARHGPSSSDPAPPNRGAPKGYLFK